MTHHRNAGLKMCIRDSYETEQVRDAVVGRFGAEVAPGGVVDRAALAERAFATAEDRAWLERLLWPLVGARLAAWRTCLLYTSRCV